jgi:hypothetical protein
LYYLQSRYYDPEVGRFLNADDVALLGANGDFASLNLFSYCGNNPVSRADNGGTFWNFVIGGIIGGVIGGISAAVSSYESTGQIDVGTTLLGIATGVVGGLVGASGMSALGQATISGVLGAVTNVGSAILQGDAIDPWSVAGDFAIGFCSSLIGSAVSKKTADLAKSTINKGINRVVSGKARYDSGSRYWKGAMKRGMALISAGVRQLNTAQGVASVVGSATGGALSIGKTLAFG